MRQPLLAAASAEVSAARQSVHIFSRAPQHIILPSTCISANKQVAQMKIIKSHGYAPARKINISCMHPASWEFQLCPARAIWEMMRYIQYNIQCINAILRGAGAGPMHSRLDSSRPPVCHSNLQPIRNAFDEPVEPLNGERILIGRHSERKWSDYSVNVSSQSPDVNDPREWRS